MAKISRDIGTGNLHPRENLFLSGTLGSVNAEVIVASDGCSSVSLDLRGTFNMTVEVAGTVDGTNWVPLPVKPAGGGQVYVLAITGAVAGAWIANCAGYKSVRARCTAYTSGAATAFLIASTAINELIAVKKATDLAVTATAVISTAVTLTLPAAGAGLFHYISRLLIQRIAGALLTAAATPIIVTTTNMPGAKAYSLPADAAAQGAIAQEIAEPSEPMRSSVANTATTVVAPLTTGVIWRITADYYIAP